jgi:uncharacterized membrane protein YkgB
MEAVGRHCVQYGLVLVLLWIGGMKFTAYEAEGISGFVTNSPLMSWVYSVFSIRGFSSLLGATEIVIGLLIAARPLSVRGPSKIAPTRRSRVRRLSACSQRRCVSC